ncbi:sigma-54-dependent Fis family transcriptional regulator [Sinomonas sp. P10A9]|uniref:Sigma-54-dependent Fis family transcriptional regulator n=1 Tax=Sinomonas puerhi TaxID=3238584 RepID=A0AB39L1W1_9MICC
MSERDARELDRLRAARDLLVERGLLVQKELAGISPSIERSWRRSVSVHASNAPAPPRFIDSIDARNPLVVAAGPVLDRWQDSLSDMRVAVFLSDRSGQIVARRLTDRGDGRRLDRAFATEGFDFSESALGTNGLGTPMEDRAPVFVRGPEHFNDSLESLACAGAPILDPRTGRVVGSIAFAATLKASNPLMLAMAREAAQQVEARLVEMNAPIDLAATAAFLRSRSSKDPVLVLSAETVIADVRALAVMSPDTHALLWDKLQKLEWKEPSNVVELPASSKTADVHRLGGGSVFALELHGRDDDEHAPQDVAARQPVGRAADAAELEAASRVSGIVALAGPPGAGKHYSARDWLISRADGEEPLTLDAAAAPTAGMAGMAELATQAVQAGRSVVVRHIDVLDLPGFRTLEPTLRLVADAARRGSGTREGTPDTRPRIVLTFDDESLGEQVRSRIVALAPISTIPALRRMRDIIPGLVRTIIDEWPEDDRVAVPPAVMQALVGWDWPGNVSELRTTLELLIAQRGGRVLRVDDLPEHLRRQTRSLSTIEALEYDAIVDALRRAGGNRSAAAAALGIGRTTLYRKMHAYGLDREDKPSVAR